MTAASLKRIVEEALAEVGATVNFKLVPKGKARTTTWLGVEHGFGAPNTLFAQFRKVKRQRNKWVCDLLAGTATLDNLDYAFARCDATFVLTFGK